MYFFFFKSPGYCSRTIKKKRFSSGTLATL